jgi:hypothetical protein
MADNDNEGWAPKNREEYIDALHQAQLKTETHRWEQAVGLKAHADEEAAKAAANNGGADGGNNGGGDGGNGGKRKRSFL